jgi:hypothetical protein
MGLLDRLEVEQEVVIKLATVARQAVMMRTRQMMVQVTMMMTWTLQMKRRKKKVQKEERLRTLSGITQHLPSREVEFRVSGIFC